MTVLIIGFPNEEIPKLIMDVQFADKGIATNMNEEISSLPVVEGTTNAIETRWNSSYEKYEAVLMEVISSIFLIVKKMLLVRL